MLEEYNTTAIHQSPQRAENQDGGHKYLLGEVTQLQITRAHHVLKIKMAAISICWGSASRAENQDGGHQ